MTPQEKSPGCFVVVVGPDGVGKTAVAQTLLEARQGRYFHFRPPFTAAKMPRRVPHQDPPLTKDPGPSFPPLGWLRLARNFVSSWIGYLTAVRPSKRRGDLVVGDRWMYGYLVQPRPLRYAGPGWLARWTIALLPNPDLVVNLTAPVDVILARKDELMRDEVESELEAWEQLPVGTLVTVDTSADLSTVVREVFKHLPRGS